jgi:hypothetical protein
MALVGFAALPPGPDKDAIERLTEGYASTEDYFVDRLSRGLARAEDIHRLYAAGRVLAR